MSGGGLGLLVVLLFFGLAGGVVGRMKGNGFTVWFLISACVPFIGLLCAVLARREDSELRRLCPSCGRVLALHDVICTRCGEELEFPETALPPRLRATRRAA